MADYPSIFKGEGKLAIWVFALALHVVGGPIDPSGGPTARAQRLPAAPTCLPLHLAVPLTFPYGLTVRQ